MHRGLDVRAVAAELRVPDVVEHDQHDVRRGRRWLGSGGHHGVDSRHVSPITPSNSVIGRGYGWCDRASGERGWLRRVRSATAHASVTVSSSRAARHDHEPAPEHREQAEEPEPFDGGAGARCFMAPSPGGGSPPGRSCSGTYCAAPPRERRRDEGPMKWRVIQWATGFVGQEAIRGCSRIPSSSSSGCGCTATEKVGKDAGELAGLDPIGVTATTTSTAARARRRLRGLRPGAREHGTVIRLLEAGTNVVTPVGWIYPPRVAEGRGDRGRLPTGQRDVARHRDQPGRHHRATAAAPVVLVSRHPARPGRGVLRHPQLPDRVGRARRHDVRHAARGGADDARCRRSSGRASASPSTWSPASSAGSSTRRSARRTRWRSPRGPRHAGRRDRGRAPSPRSASRGRASSMVSP